MSCGACSAWRRWHGPVDATGEPLLAPDAQPTCAELGSACDAPPDELQGGEVELTEGVAAAAPVVVHPLLGATRRAPVSASV